MNRAQKNVKHRIIFLIPLLFSIVSCFSQDNQGLLISKKYHFQYSTADFLVNACKAIDSAAMEHQFETKPLKYNKSFLLETDSISISNVFNDEISMMEGLKNYNSDKFYVIYIQEDGEAINEYLIFIYTKMNLFKKELVSIYRMTKNIGYIYSNTAIKFCRPLKYYARAKPKFYTSSCMIIAEFDKKKCTSDYQFIYNFNVLEPFGKYSKKIFNFRLY